MNEYEDKLSRFYKIVGANVKKERMQKNLTQLELSQLLGFSSTSSISNPEINYRGSHFSLSQLFMIAEVLQIDISLLIKQVN